jgi:hypothetical protein
MRDLVLGAHAVRRVAGTNRSFVCLLVSGLVAACSPFEDVSAKSPAIRTDEPDSGGRGADDAGPDGEVTEPPTVAPDQLVQKGDCFLRRPPAEPARDDVDPDGEDLPELILAAHNIRSGEQPDEDGEPTFKTIGYDLDGECSTEPMSHACSVAEFATPGAVGAIDGNDGIDNAVGAAFHHVFVETKGSATLAGNGAANSGERTYVVRIRDYNGQPNDSDVTVSTFAVTFSRPPGAMSSVPSWTGSDEWLGYDIFFEVDAAVVDSAVVDAAVVDAAVVDAAVEEGETLPPVKFPAERAYVVQNRLVAHFAQAPSTYGMFTHLFVTGTLRERPGLGWVLDDAVMGGRILVDALLGILDRTRGEDLVNYVCTDHPQYESFKAVRCSLGDVSYDRADAPSSLCDGVSWAWGFDAVPAKVVGIHTYEAEFHCPEGKRPGIDDHCDPALNGTSEE